MAFYMAGNPGWLCPNDPDFPPNLNPGGAVVGPADDVLTLSPMCIMNGEFFALQFGPVKAGYVMMPSEGGDHSPGRFEMIAFSMPPESVTLQVDFTEPPLAEGGVGNIWYLVTETSDQPSESDVGWSTVSPTGELFDSQGTYHRWAWAKDDADHIVGPIESQTTITIPG